MSDDILAEQDGPVLRLTLNRPDAGNAATDAMAAQLTRLLEHAAERSRLVLLRGAGADFCVGRAPTAPPPRPEEALDRRRQSDVIFDCYGAFRRSAVPVVCAVQGRALGFGCALAAVADITVASEQAVFQIPEMQHRILPTMVLSALADRATRKGLAYMVYSAAPVGAERALAYGVVSEVAPAAKLDATVERLCASIAGAPAPAVGGVKEYLRHAMTMDTPAAVDFARNLHAVVNSSSEMRK
jgi:enoyl-CoA hydratase